MSIPKNSQAEEGKERKEETGGFADYLGSPFFCHHPSPVDLSKRETCLNKKSTAIDQQRTGAKFYLKMTQMSHFSFCTTFHVQRLMLKKNQILQCHPFYKSTSNNENIATQLQFYCI